MGLPRDDARRGNFPFHGQSWEGCRLDQPARCAGAVASDPGRTGGVEKFRRGFAGVGNPAAPQAK